MARDFSEAFGQTNTLFGTLADVQAFLTQTATWTAANVGAELFEHRARVAAFRDQLLAHIGEQL